MSKEAKGIEADFGIRPWEDEDSEFTMGGKASIVPFLCPTCPDLHLQIKLEYQDGSDSPPEDLQIYLDDDNTLQLYKLLMNPNILDEEEQKK